MSGAEKEAGLVLQTSVVVLDACDYLGVGGVGVVGVGNHPTTGHVAARFPQVNIHDSKHL